MLRWDECASGMKSKCFDDVVVEENVFQSQADVDGDVWKTGDGDDRDKDGTYKDGRRQQKGQEQREQKQGQ